MQRALLTTAAMALSVLSLARTAEAAQACGVTPVLLVVQDRSGSMADPPSGTTTQSKWSISTSVVPSVLANYQSGFSYGLQTFPAASGVCDTGVTTLGVGASVSQIQQAYSGSTPGGATPTALTLLAARDYLNSLNLSVPAYVLLITDGQPNCNGSLDGNSCSCTKSTKGCVPANGGTAYNCLDDNRTETAAAAVRAAGYPVYVVGFGASSTVDNNAAVLDSIAQQGGTNHAYSALDQSSLSTALNQIVGGVTGCCSNTCTPNTYQCAASGAVQKCEVQASGCYDWSTYGCANGTTCSGGSCQACTGTCTAGVSECTGNGVATCVADANGCTAWSYTGTCASGELCQQGGGQAACESCNGACVAGARQCASGGVAQECVADGNGCTAWVDDPCAAGTTCSGGICTGCNGCNAGDTQCAGNIPLSCVADGQGCTAWVPGNACDTASQACDNGACVDCSGACAAGSTRCGANGVETCTAQQNACNAWVPTDSCQAGCANGACCTTTCTVGAVQCGADGSVQTCVDQGGCAGWVSSTCGDGQGCSDGQCLLRCNGNGEINDCPNGGVCTNGFCQPGSTGSTSGTGTTGGGASTGGTGTTGLGAPDAGMDSGGTSGTPVDRPSNQAVGQGCGCGAIPTSELGLALPFVLALVARRKRS